MNDAAPKAPEVDSRAVSVLHGIATRSSAVSSASSAASRRPRPTSLTAPSARSFALSKPSRAFGPGLDLEAIRVKEGANVLSAGAPARTVGNTIYVNSSRSPADLELIAHESVHAWQYQHGGTQYIAGSLEVQAAAGLGGGDRNGAYEFAAPIVKGSDFRGLNPEQQANLMQKAQEAGMFASDEALKAVRVVVGGVDYTDAVRAAQANLRAGEGAP